MKIRNAGKIWTLARCTVAIVALAAAKAASGLSLYLDDPHGDHLDAGPGDMADKGLVTSGADDTQLAWPVEDYAQLKVIGGLQAPIGSAQFIASLRAPQGAKTVQGENVSGRHFCGGVLIAEDVILTAAHCVKKMKTRNFPVHIGRYMRKGSDEEQFEKLMVKDIKIHESYDEGVRLNYDIALLMLSGKSKAVPVNLRRSEACSVARPCNWGVVYGWGTIDSLDKSSVSDRLMYVRVPILPRGMCRSVYGGSQITEAMLCAGGEIGRDSCRGDSGSPLIINGEVGGIVSFGAEDCGTLMPGVYTNIATVAPWIDDQLKQIRSQAEAKSSQPSSSQRRRKRCMYISGRWFPRSCHG